MIVRWVVAQGHGDVLFCCGMSTIFDPMDRQTAYKARYGQGFGGLIVPFGVGVHRKPSRKKDIDAKAKFGPGLSEGVMVGYHQNAGGGWSGDVEAIDAHELTNAGDISEVH